MAYKKASGYLMSQSNHAIPGSVYHVAYPIDIIQPYNMYVLYVDNTLWWLIGQL